MTALISQFVNVDDGVLEVFRGGADRPVICGSHPFAPDPDAARWYTEHAAVVYMMPRGTGGSSPLGAPGDLPLRRAARDLEIVRRRLGIGHWVVQGFSAGSQVALEDALAYPDALAGLIVGFSGPSGAAILADPRSAFSPAHPDYEADLAAAAPLLRTTAAQDGLRWLHPRPDLWVLAEKGEAVAALRRNEEVPRLMAHLAESAHWDVSDRLHEIVAPTLVVCGRRDPLVPPEGCAAIAAGPSTRLLTLEQTGHVAVAAADADAFREAVREFLAGIASTDIS